MLRWILPVTAVVFLAGCQSSSVDQSSCTAVGAPGTAAYGQCLMIRQQQRQSRSIALMNFGGAMMTAGQPQRPVNTTCARNGAFVNCTSY